MTCFKPFLFRAGAEGIGPPTTVLETVVIPLNYAPGIKFLIFLASPDLAKRDEARQWIFNDLIFKQFEH